MCIHPNISQQEMGSQGATNCVSQSRHRKNMENGGMVTLLLNPSTYERLLQAETEIATSLGIEHCSTGKLGGKPKIPHAMFV